MRSTPSGGTVLLCAAFAFMTVVELARAAEMSLRMSLRLGEGYNDNVRLVSDSHPNVTITTIAPAVEVKAHTETVTAVAKAQASINRYRGDSDLNATDLAIEASMAKLYERGQIGIRTEYVRDSTLASELSQTGVVQENRQRARASVNPSWTTQLSERASVQLGYDFAQIKYEDAAGTGLTDYQTESPYGVFSYRLSERSSIQALTGMSQLRRAGGGSVRNIYAQTLLESQLTEVLKAKVGVGLSRIRSNSTLAKDAESGWLAQASIERSFLTSTLAVGLERENNPTGSGELTQTDRLSALWTEKLSPRFSYALGAAAYRNQPIFATSAIASDTYYRLNGNVTYLVTEDWSIEADIAHAHQRPDQGESVQANSFFLSTRYSLPTHLHSF